MICPMKFNATILDRAGCHYEGDLECEKENCAWWNRPLEVCSIAVLAIPIDREIYRKELKDALSS